MLIHCISRRPSHIFPALLLLLLIYWLCLWVKMDQSLRLAGTPARVIIGGGVAGDAAGNGPNCIAAAVATTQPDTTADVPAEISGVGAVAVAAAVAAEKPDKAEKTEEKTEEAGDKKKQKKEKKEEAAEKKVVAKDVEAWWKQQNGSRSEESPDPTDNLDYNSAFSLARIFSSSRALTARAGDNHKNNTTVSRYPDQKPRAPNPRSAGPFAPAFSGGCSSILLRVKFADGCW
ncbi:uncharacterized protein B0T23DRAFT_433866 [Neurospora hispaniola]|uniref:Uncharacterized protein n=1 Tax=Neurospora hispaniola TaxID=588809 RepID=A0AAJ0IEI7_9PEZI|nr:hypothetical protein B0T23DRAFT_433866 [Neurospora hispaniola]